jgi:hypothetical protein
MMGGEPHVDERRESMHEMIKITFSGYEVFPNAEITDRGEFSHQFIQIGMKTFHDACKWVNDLPYDYNSDMVDSKLIFTEKKGVCLTKHGAIARLAEEIGLSIRKNIGFFRLNDEIYTGIGKLLERYGLDYIPQIDCFLQYEDHCVDLTDGNCTGKNKAIDEFDFIVPVPPEISMDEMIILYMQYIEKYAEFEPRFNMVGMDKILTALSECTTEMQARCCIAPS